MSFLYLPTDLSNRRVFLCHRRSLRYSFFIVSAYLFSMFGFKASHEKPYTFAGYIQPQGYQRTIDFIIHIDHMHVFDIDRFQFIAVNCFRHAQNRNTIPRPRIQIWVALLCLVRSQNCFVRNMIGVLAYHISTIFLHCLMKDTYKMITRSFDWTKSI